MMGQGAKRLLVLAAATAALLVGCGGGSDDGAEALSANEYAQQAEAICRKTEDQRTKKLQQVIEEHPVESTDREEATKLIAEAAKPIYQDMIEELESLEPPTGAKGDEYEEWVSAFEEALAQSEAGEPEDEVLAATVAAHHKARGAGLLACAVL